MNRFSGKNKINFLLLSYMLLVTFEVAAIESIYVGGIGGVLLTRDLAVNKSNLVPDLPPDVEIKYKPGYKIGLFAGLKFPFIRAEAEFSRLKSEAKEIVVSGVDLRL